MKLFMVAGCVLATATLYCSYPVYAADAPSAPGSRTSQSEEAALQEVVVTARKREEDLQSVPVAVTAFSGEQLRARTILQPSDLQYDTPSLTVATDSTQGSNGASYAIRGQGVGFQGNPGVITYFAGAPGGGGQEIFYDLANVQVLKGPQGTLFGRTSTGGAVLFEPQKPTGEWDGYLQASFGNMAYKKLEGAINIPIIGDQLDLRVAGFAVRRTGYSRSLTTGQKFDNTDREGFRATLRFKPSAAFDNNLIVQYSNINEVGTSFLVTDVNPNAGGFQILAAGPAIGAGFFATAVCPADAARYGLTGATAAAFNSGCGAQRYALLSSSLSQLQAAQASTAAGNIRDNFAGQNDFYKNHTWSFINNSLWNLGGAGSITEAYVKNILSYSLLGVGSGGAAGLGAGGAFEGDGIAAGQLDAVEYSSTLAPGPCVTSGPNIGQCTFLPLVPGVNPDQPKTLTEEVNVSGKLWNRLELIAGYFYLRTTQGDVAPPSVNVFNNVFNPGLEGTYSGFGQSDSVNTERGEFFQGTSDLSDWLLRGLSLTGGFRHTAVNNSVGSRNSYQGPVDELRFSGSGNNRTVGLEWKINPALLLYFRSGTGFKPGGNNANCTGLNEPVTCPPVYASETVTDYELGMKTDYQVAALNGRTNVAVYTSNYDDIQRNQIALLNGASIGLNRNVAKATIKGFEFEQIMALGHASINLAYSYTDAGYSRFFVSNPPAQPCTDPNNSAHDCADVSGSTFAQTPKNKGSATIRYEFELGDQGQVIPSVQWSYTGSEFYGFDSLSTPYETAPSYSLLNARIDWKNIFGHPIDIQVFGRNLLDKDYVTYKLPTYVQLGFNSAHFGEPVNYGIEVRYRFGSSASR